MAELGTHVVDEVLGRDQKNTTGHRGRKSDQLFGVQTILRAGAEILTDKQQNCVIRVVEAVCAQEEVFVAWQRSVAASRLPGPGLSLRAVDWPRRSLRIYSIHEVARLGRTPDAGPLHLRPSEQRRYRGHERHHRAPPPPPVATATATKAAHR